MERSEIRDAPAFRCASCGLHAYALRICRGRDTPAAQRRAHHPTP
jgi:hypothetical protein